MGEVSEKRLQIQKMQRQVRIESLKNKIRQFDIKVLELEEDIEAVKQNRSLSEQALQKELDLESE